MAVLEKKKNASTICIDPNTVKGWQSTSIETWLNHVRKIRQRNTNQGLKQRFDGTSHTDKLMTKRAKLLALTSTPNFKKWRLKTHYETA